MLVYSLGSDDDEEWIHGVGESLKNDEKVSRKHAHCILIGPPGSGKSSLLHRLLGNEAVKRFTMSTGVSNPIVVVNIDDSNPATFHPVTMIDPNTWEEIDFSKSILGELRKVQEMSAHTSPQPEPSQAAAVFQPATPSVAASGHSVLHTEARPAQSVADVSPAKLSDSDIRALVLPLAKQYGSFSKFKRSSSLYLRDTGGQVEFQEMISVLVYGPSIFFFVFRLDCELQSTFSIEYRVSEGESTNCYTSSITIEDAFLQCLASVYAMDTSDKAGVKTHKPLVFVVGTHKDNLPQPAERKIAELNKHLDSLISSNSCFQHLVEYADWRNHQVMFTVDNTSESDADFKPIRSRVNSLVNKCDEFSIEYPISYLLFCLQLQNLRSSILSFEECKVMAAKYGIVGDEQVSHLLQFLHLRVGVIQYFNVAGLRHIVVKEPQVLFNKVTNLIIKTFSCKALFTSELRAFEEKGIVTASVLKRVLVSKDELTCEDFLKLLVHLRIIAPFPPSSEDREERFFVPCVLNHMQGSSQEDPHTDISPLYLKFKCEHCPKGLFGVLVTHLMSPEESDGTSFTLSEDRIFKDCVSFDVHSTGVHDKMSLKIHPSRLELNFFPDLSEDRDTPIEQACCRVREIVESSISKALENLHYSKEKVKPEVCLKCQDCQELHAVEKGKEHYKMHCKKAHKTNRISVEARCWFDEGKLRSSSDGWM